MGGGKKRWRCCENRLTIAMAVGLSTKPSESDNQGCFADGNTSERLAVLVAIVGVALASMQLRLGNSCRVNYYKE